MESVSTCMLHSPFNEKGQDHMTCPFQCEEFFRCKTQWDYCHPVWQQENHKTSTPVRGGKFKTSQDLHMPSQPQQRQGRVMKYRTYHKVCCSSFPWLCRCCSFYLTLPDFFLPWIRSCFAVPFFFWLFLYGSSLCLEIPSQRLPQITVEFSVLGYIILGFLLI